VGTLKLGHHTHHDSKKRKSDATGACSKISRLAQPALAEMLTAAETVLAATGNAVALCPAWGMDACGQGPS